MSFNEALSAAQTWAAANLPVAVGGVVALLVLMVLLLSQLPRRRTAGLDPAKLRPGTAPGPTSSDNAREWVTPEQSYADRRAAVRRDGPPVRVLLTGATFRNGAGDGYVVDRSTGGLKLATQSPVPPGTTVQVRAVDAPDTVGFVAVIVRSCRKNADYYELGCEFEKTPPWSVLLLFG